VAVEYFSKWIEAKPLATITSVTIQKFFWQNIVCRFGVPKAITVDNGTQFDSEAIIPKGAQCKFSAQKSFLRECRAKYRRNIRRRTSKDVPKGMQNLYRRNRRRRSSKDVLKGMQNLHRKISGEAENKRQKRF
jgi:hypothetical protein